MYCFMMIAKDKNRKMHTGLKTWMSWFLETKWELFAMHVAVSSLSPVSIQIWAMKKIDVNKNMEYILQAMD